MYARRVLGDTAAGPLIVAGPLVRLACERHLRDRLESAIWWFSEDAADVAIEFYERVLKLPDVLDAEGNPKPFILHHPLDFIVGSIMGWMRPEGYRRFREAYIEMAKGNAKCLALDTPIPTPTGWSTMGALKVGDRVFDERGVPCAVVGAFNVLLDHPCFEVRFDDGNAIVADADHLWMTEQRTFIGDRGESKRGIAMNQRGGWRRGLRTTAQIAATLRYPNGRYQSANHSIDLAGALDLPDARLPIEPYCLGVWLGDGDSDGARITAGMAECAEIRELVTAAGVPVGAVDCQPNRAPRFRLGDGFHSSLRAEGLLKHKHIPAAYLRASIGQRLDLLQGLMDTDGSIAKSNGQCVFGSTLRTLADGVAELVESLGVKLTLLERRSVLNGHDYGPFWCVSFFPPADLPVFRLARKRKEQYVRHGRRRLSGDRRIVSCERVPSVPVRCIAVDSPSNLYLAGHGMIPTHNTPMLAGLGLFGLTMTSQPAPEIYSAGTVREQSLIMFRDACRMVEVSPGMREFHVKKSVNNLSCGMGFFRPYSRDQGQKSGWRPYFALIDEVHEHPSADTINKLVAGFKDKLDPLAVEITNSGFDRTSICWQHHLRAERMLQQTITDDHLFAFVCDLDEGDDPVNDESCWPKTNPLLDTVVTREYLRRQVQNMKNVPASYNENMRLNFCVWTQQDFRAINMVNWRACKELPPESALIGVPCFGGLDLGQHDDFTAWVLIWLLHDGRVAVRPRFWIPNQALETYPNRPYSEWRRQKLLDVTEGSTTYYALVEQAILEDCRKYAVREVAYDKRFAEQMAQNLQGAGVNLTNQPQGFELNESCRRLQELITTGDLCHGNHEVLGWMASNYVERHGIRGDVRPDKETASEKIDGIVATEMALMCSIRAPKPAEVSLFFLPRRR